jgi:hypothetical protein
MKDKGARGEKPTTKQTKSQHIDLRPLLPGGSVERDFRRLTALSLERGDFFTDAWLVAEQPIPSFVPVRARKAVFASAKMRLREKGLANRKIANAEDAEHLRKAAKFLQVKSDGRPAGPSLEWTRLEFLEKVKAAILEINKKGLRVTHEKVAEKLNRDGRTLRRHRSAFGFSSWKQLRDTAIEHS